MGAIKNIPPSVRLIGAFSRHPDCLDWLWAKVNDVWGEILLTSDRFSFVESEYYHKTMGENLIKQFAICAPQYDPSCLAVDKLLTNDWEENFRNMAVYTEERPLNIDPGYITATKLVLASTKNREHRLYLKDGIYAEVTLAFRNQQWVEMPWTYPDYQREDFQTFFSAARRILLKQNASR